MAKAKRNQEPVKQGRPRNVMTEEKVEAILRAVRVGLHPDRAAEAAGVPAAAMRQHKRRNPDFVTALKEAAATAEQSYLGRILLHTEKQWTACAWILERRWPERWAKREPKEPPTKDDARKLLDDIRAIKALEENVAHAATTSPQATTPTQGGETSS